MSPTIFVILTSRRKIKWIEQEYQLPIVGILDISAWLVSYGAIARLPLNCKGHLAYEGDVEFCTLFALTC